MNWSLFFWVLVAFSSFVHGFEAVQPMFTKIDILRNYESHQDWISSSWLTHMNTQAFRKISQLVIFRLSSCDLSPPLKPIVGGSSKVHKMSYTHPNSIPSVAMGYRRQEEEIWKNHFEIFRTTNCDLSTSSPISQKWNILISTHPIVKLKIVLEILGSGEDMIKFFFLYFEFFTSVNPCDSSPPPRWNHEPETQEKFLKHVFSFFNPSIPFSLETRPKFQIGYLFYQNPHLASSTHFDLEIQKNL